MNKDEIHERIRQVLGEVYMPEGVEIWLFATHRAGPLAGRCPNDMIESGEGAEALAVAESLTGQIAT